MARGLLVLILCISGIVLAGAVPGVAQSGFEITVAGSVDTPDRNVSFEGSEYPVSDIAKSAPGGELSVHVATPDVDDLIYRVYLYNADRQIVDSKRGTKPTRFHFDLAGYRPGSYMLVVQHRGEFKAVHPVVVPGYETTIDAPSSVDAGSRLQATVRVRASAADGEPAGVAVALTNETTTIRVNATRQGRGEYTARVPTRSLAVGRYELYAVVQGEREVFGRAELLGLSDPIHVNVTPPTGTASPEPTTTTGRPTTTTEGDSSPTTQTTTSGVITPVGNPDSTTTPGQPGFGIPAVIGTLLAVVLYARSRIRSQDGD